MKHRMHVAVCACLVLIAISADAIAYDGMVDRTRTQQEPMNSEVLAYLTAGLNEAHNYISSIFWVDGVVDYQYSNTDHDFINHINSMNPTIPK